MADMITWKKVEHRQFERQASCTGNSKGPSGSTLTSTCHPRVSCGMLVKFALVNLAVLKLSKASGLATSPSRHKQDKDASGRDSSY